MYTLPVVWPLYVFGFIFGACVTSFICLAVDRLPHQLGWREDPIPNLNIAYPPSRCDLCGNQISWLYLLPIIGYFISKGRCHHCKTEIPFCYPLLELIGGLLVIGLLYWLGFTLTAILTIILFLTLLFLSWMDINEHWLPAVVTFPLFWLGLVLSPFETDPMQRIYGACLGFFLIYFVMKLVSYFKDADILAGGDIALITVAGAWLGLNQLPFYLILSCIIFIVYSIPARIKGILFMPMGPALACGFLICLYR